MADSSDIDDIDTKIIIRYWYQDFKAWKKDIGEEAGGEDNPR